MASETLKNIVVKLGANSKELLSELARADVAVSSFVSKAKSAFAGLDFGTGFAQYVKSFADLGNDLAMFSASTGIAVEDVSRLGGVLEYFGGNIDTAKSALSGLQKAAMEASLGTGPLIDISREYGLELKGENGQVKDAVSLYEDLADVYGDLTNAQKADLVSRLGLDSSSVLVLQKGKTALRGMMEEQSKLAGITAQDAAGSREWINSITRLQQTFASLGGDIASKLIPVINDVTKFVTDLTEKFRANRELVDKVADVIKNNLVTAFAFAAASIGKAMLPLMRSLGPLTVLALLVNDISKFMQGENSVLGDLFGEKGDAVREKFKNLVGGFGGILSSLLTGDFDGALKQFGVMWNESIMPLAIDFVEMLSNKIIEYLPVMIDNIFKLLPTLADVIAKIVTSTIFSMVGGIVNIINSIAEKLGLDPLFKGEDGKAKEGSSLASELVEGYHYFFDFLSDKFLKTNFTGSGESTDKTDVKREMMAKLYNVTPSMKREDHFKDRPPVNGATVNPSKITNNNVGGITNNFNATINSSGPVDGNTVKQGMIDAAAKMGWDFSVINGLALTGRQ